MGETVSVDYIGWTVDGRKFDCSLDPGRAPIMFRMGKGEVIKGWEEGISTMKSGGIRRLVIPPDLAYGELGRPPIIEPNSTLVFMVRLLQIEPAK
ncbi:MAG: FKBP-type peptidyl-prolyl cis-trans isomerase [Armatimonadetes bacterium]|nr:FKBP-type peptidyl-prolyl cis-trans isomerase [Armatimonadota bacterium]